MGEWGVAPYNKKNEYFAKGTWLLDVADRRSAYRGKTTCHPTFLVNKTKAADNTHARAHTHARELDTFYSQQAGMQKG